jgi:PAS domain S-box-containing protein
LLAPPDMQKLHGGAGFARTDETHLEEMKRYVRLDDRDAQMLRAFRPVAAPHFDRIAREFYERIREHEDAHAVFTGEAQILRLQRSLVAWMARILSGSYDEAYAEETRKIGVVHVRVGLPQRYMFTAMALIRVALEAITETLVVDATPTRVALTRVLDLELALMVESYREHLEGLVRRHDELSAVAARADLTGALGLYQLAIDLVPDLVLGIDRLGQVRFVNRTARLVTGYPDEELVGTPFVAMLVPEDLQPGYHQRLAALLGDGVPGQPEQHEQHEQHEQPEQREQSVIRTRAGKLRDVVWVLSRLPQETGHGVVILIVGSDITDARIVSQRVQRQQQLLAIGTLAAGLAHEIRNPLNAAQLHVSFVKRLLASQPAHPEVLDAIHVVGDEIMRLARLVSEFLAFAEPRPLVKTRSVVQAILARAVAAAGAPAGIAIAISAPVEDLMIVVDATRIELVILHLLENAIDALALAGTGEIAVRAHREPRTIVLEVEDDGAGLPSPQAPVFDAFFSTKPTGTGLGLAVSHRIVTDHGGTIDVDSRPGRTCFRVVLPLDEDHRASPGVRP